VEHKICYHTGNNYCRYDIFYVPIIIGALGIITKGLKKSLEAIPGKTFNGFITHHTQYGKYCSMTLGA
jgi:hypothetical protein